jgi:hypothetical protein
LRSGWYIFGMAKQRKSPQEKKSLEYTRDSFTFAQHSSFPKTWKRKKTRANRELRRKSDELLSHAKPGMEAEEMALVAEDMTAALFQKSVVRKALRKTGTVTVGEKVERKLAKREGSVGRRTRSHEPYDRAANSAVQILTSLEGKKFDEVVRRAGILLGALNAKEWLRLRLSTDPLDQALYFLHQLTNGSGYEIGAMCRNEELGAKLNAWVAKANRVLARDQRAVERKAAQKEMAILKVNSLRRAANPES